MPFFPSQTIQGLDVGSFADKYAQKLYPARKKQTSFFPQPKQLTPSQQELLPYLQIEAEKKAKKKGLLQPVEALFNLLNRGQFLTAGIAQQVINNIEDNRPVMEDMPETIKQAVTGKVQYDWEVVLFGGKHRGGEEYEGLMPWDPTTGAGKFGKGAAGFIANVALDPLTYVGFGPSTAAKGAATRYADDVVKFAIRGIGKDAKKAIPEMVQKGFSKKLFAEKLGKSVPKALQYMQKYSGGDVTKFYSKLSKQAYKKALRTPGKELTDPLLKEFGEELGEKGVSKGAKSYLEKTIAELKASPYAGAGQRAGRFMRAEFGVGERYPNWLKTMDKLKSRMAKSKIGGKFSDAWWGLMNNPKSPVANIRKMFHVRNPYQKLLSVMERDIISESSHSMVIKGERIMRSLDDLTDVENKAVRDFMIQSQIMQEAAKKTGEVPLRASELVQKYGDKIDVDKVIKKITEINTMTKEWRQFNVEAYEKGLASKVGEWQDYLPEQRVGSMGAKRAGTQMGAAKQAYTRPRKAGWSGNIKAQVEKIKWMYGVDDATAKKVLMGGGGDLNVDLQDMLMRRAFAQTRFEQRINMIESFREFGVNLNEVKKLPGGKNIYRELTGQWGQLEQLGLKPIQGKGLKGYVFDREIADVLQRVVDLGSNDQSMKAAAKALSSFTSWWRGWATLSPGFHARNFYSNNMTGFLKHGMEWFNPNVHLESMVGTAIGLHGKEAGIRQLSKIMPDSLIKEVMGRQIGNQRIVDLADWAGSKGIITRMSKGYGQPESFKELVKMEGKLFESINLNPMSTQNVAMKGSRQLGSFIESSAKFQSFLLDLRRSVKQGGSMQAGMDYAKREARKWWIDYGDLTDFEKKTMKNIIPFYTWIRGNIANQLTGLLQFTEMYAMIPKATQAFTAEGGPSREETPDWMRELGMFPIDETDGKPRMFWPNFPYQDLNKIPIKFQMDEETGFPVPMAGSPWDLVSDIAADAHPLIKSVIQVIPKEGVDIFYQEPLGETRKAPRALRLLTKSKGLLGFLDGMMRRAGFEEGMRVDVNKKGQLIMDAKMAKVLEDNILPLRMIPQYLDLPELMFPVLEDWKRKITGAVDDYDAVEQFMQTLSFYAGVKMKDLELEDYEFREKEELLEKAQAAKRKMTKKLPGAETRSQTWKQKRKEYQKRLGL